MPLKRPFLTLKGDKCVQFGHKELAVGATPGEKTKPTSRNFALSPERTYSSPSKPRQGGRQFAPEGTLLTIAPPPSTRRNNSHSHSHSQWVRTKFGNTAFDNDTPRFFFFQLLVNLVHKQCSFVRFRSGRSIRRGRGRRGCSEQPDSPPPPNKPKNNPNSADTKCRIGDRNCLPKRFKFKLRTARWLFHCPTPRMGKRCYWF